MKKNIVVGGSFDESIERVIDAVRRVDRGEDIEAQRTVSFANWSALAAVMTDKRYALLQHLRAQPAVSIRALARDLGRDFKRVHGDVNALAAAGLVEHDERGWRVDWDEIHTVIRANPAA
jgi:predicted transcriptional regulator